MRPPPFSSPWAVSGASQPRGVMLVLFTVTRPGWRHDGGLAPALQPLPATPAQSTSPSHSSTGGITWRTNKQPLPVSPKLEQSLGTAHLLLFYLCDFVSLLTISCALARRPMASLVLTDSSQLTSDSQHLVDQEARKGQGDINEWHGQPTILTASFLMGPESFHEVSKTLNMLGSMQQHEISRITLTSIEKRNWEQAFVKLGKHSDCDYRDSSWRVHSVASLLAGFKTRGPDDDVLAVRVAVAAVTVAGDICLFSSISQVGTCGSKTQQCRRKRNVETLDAYPGHQSQTPRRNCPHYKLWKPVRSLVADAARETHRWNPYICTQVPTTAGTSPAEGVERRCRHGKYLLQVSLQLSSFYDVKRNESDKSEEDLHKTLEKDIQDNSKRCMQNQSEDNAKKCAQNQSEEESCLDGCVCNKGTKTRTLLMHHIKTKHPQTMGLPETLGRPQKFPCSICNKKLSSKNTLTIHMQMHRGEKKFRCTICSKRLSSKTGLNMHIQMHKGEKNYQCTICSKKFLNKTYLMKHSISHTRERNYKCDLCDKTYMGAESPIVPLLLLSTHTLYSYSSSHPPVYEKDTNNFVWNCALHSASDVVFDCCVHAHIEAGWGGRWDCTIALAVPALA
uniref:C2H2-type domain-containing protein n=1 Tax=Timema douglasi TaxID=61478 RepID=A0A7R8Z6N8_TIMDO|nr:unnamed protein product [Timema douglasi]